MSGGRISILWTYRPSVRNRLCINYIIDIPFGNNVPLKLYWNTLLLNVEEPHCSKLLSDSLTPSCSWKGLQNISYETVKSWILSRSCWHFWQVNFRLITVQFNCPYFLYTKTFPNDVAIACCFRAFLFWNGSGKKWHFRGPLDWSYYMLL